LPEEERLPHIVRSKQSGNKNATIEPEQYIALQV